LPTFSSDKMCNPPLTLSPHPNININK
jgi:hypothetical protein